MKRGAAASLFVVALVVSLVAAAGPGRTVWNFDRDAAGQTPRGFTEQVGSWNVVESRGKKVLAQLAKNSDETFNIVLIDETKANDLDLSVKLRPIDGKLDLGGGLVWRARDAQNYYIARYNPLEANFRIYKVEEGKRTLFQNADVAPTGDWHTLRVTMAGDHVKCELDGKPLLDVHDSTFADAGKIGLWTKADARTEFDELILETR